MDRAEVSRMLGVLKATWPDRTVNAETITAYEMAWSDLPCEVVKRAVAEHLRVGKFFPAPSEIRALALRRETGTPPAEIAWDEVRRQIANVGMYGNPSWSTRTLEDTVRAIGWRAIFVCEEDDLGTLRAQFRNTYERYAQETVAGDAGPALAEASARRAAIERAKGHPSQPGWLGDPAKAPPAVPYLRPVAALPAAPDPEPAAEPGVPYAIARARKRFEERNPQKALKPLAIAGDPAAILRRITESAGWADLPADTRRAQLARFLARHPECADLPEMSGVTADDGADAGLAALAGLVRDVIPSPFPALANGGDS